MQVELHLPAHHQAQAQPLPQLQAPVLLSQALAVCQLGPSVEEHTAAPATVQMPRTLISNVEVV